MSWVPVEDGIVHDARNCDRLVVARGGSELVTWQNSDGHVAKLHEKLRLCRQVPDAASVPTFAFNWDIIPADYEWAAVERYMLEQWQVHAHFYEPQWDKNLGWISDGDCEHIYIVDDLPLGLDYRTLKEQRPSEMRGEATDVDR